MVPFVPFVKDMVFQEGAHRHFHNPVVLSRRKKCICGTIGMGQSIGIKLGKRGMIAICLH